MCCDAGGHEDGAAVRAEIDGEVAEVLVQPDMTVDAKDLLIVLR